MLEGGINVGNVETWLGWLVWLVGLVGLGWLVGWLVGWLDVPLLEVRINGDRSQ